MIGRFVQHQHIGFFVQDLAQAHFCLFPAAQDANLAFDVFGRKSAFGERGAYFILSVGREFFPDLIDAGGSVVVVCLLFKIAGQQILAQLTFTGKRRNQTENTLDQRSLSDSVCTGQRNFLATLQREVQRP